MNAVLTTEPPYDRAADVRAAPGLTYLTLGWMTVEGAAALWLGAASKSLPLDGYTLYGLALFVAANSLLGLTVLKKRTDTHESVWGILIGLAAKIGMPVLAGYKLEVAARLGSKALRADAMEAITCGYLSVVLMIGLAVTRLLPGLWWLDSVAALALIPLLIREGREAVTCGCCAEGE